MNLTSQVNNLGVWDTKINEAQFSAGGGHTDR